MHTPNLIPDLKSAAAARCMLAHASERILTLASLLTPLCHLRPFLHTRFLDCFECTHNTAYFLAAGWTHFVRLSNRNIRCLAQKYAICGVFPSFTWRSTSGMLAKKCERAGLKDDVPFFFYPWNPMWSELMLQITACRYLRPRRSMDGRLWNDSVQWRGTSNVRKSSQIKSALVTVVVTSWLLQPKPV